MILLFLCRTTMMMAATRRASVTSTLNTTCQNFLFRYHLTWRLSSPLPNCRAIVGLQAVLWSKVQMVCACAYSVG